MDKAQAPKCGDCFTALEEDIFSPNGYYMRSDDIPIVFYSGYTMAVTPFKEGFVGNIKKVNKSITVLFTHAKVEAYYFRVSMVIVEFYRVFKQKHIAFLLVMCASSILIVISNKRMENILS